MVELKVTKNSDKFRGPALYFTKHGQYTFAPPGTSEYIKYWTDEFEYCKYGFTAPDGDHIPGFYYFYLNYFPIDLIKEVEVEVGHGITSLRASSVRDFPSFYDYDRFYFESIEACEEYGKHLIVLKARRKGYSYKIASMLIRNFYFFRGSKGFALAAETEFLIKDGVLTKAWDGQDFLDQNTAWYKKRQVKNTMMWRRASFLQKDETGVDLELGYKSEIMGVTLKNDPQKARGKKGKLIIFEEAGKFRNLLQVWQIAKPSVEQGSHVFGTMIAFGCVMKGTKVWANNGKLFNIEELQIEDGIIGYNSKGAYKDKIYGKLNTFMKPCYRIHTTGNNYIECSYDHPLLSSKPHWRKKVKNKNVGKVATFTYTEDLKVGDQLLLIDNIDKFGTRTEKDARLIGLFIGDGNMSDGATPQLSIGDEEIFEYIKKYNYKIYKEFKQKNGNEYRSVGIKGLTDKFKEIGVYGKVKDSKTFPNNIHTYDKESLAEFIGGYFDADGSVYYREDQNRVRVTLTSSTESLLDEMKYALLQFGIHSSIVKEFRKSGYKSNSIIFRLYISNRTDVLRFKQNIKFLVSHKQYILDKVEFTSNRDNKRPKYFFRLGENNKGKFLVKFPDLENLYTESITKIEYLGEQPVYNLHTLDTNTYISNMYITKQTGGEEGEDFEGLKELFERPTAYNCLELDNIWDEDNIGQKCGFFVPQYANLEGEYYNEDDEEDPYNGESFMDVDGNTNYKVAKKFILLQRAKVMENASDRRAIDRHVAEQPIKPAEALLDLGTNIFPKADLQRHLAYIRNNDKIKNYKQVGELFFDSEAKLKWMPVSGTAAKDITKYRLDPRDDPRGQIVIWEHPVPNAPWGLYIAGTDPYDHDKSGTNSLGSTFIYKRFMNGEYYTDTVVAEYTGRPDTAVEYYENVRKLLLYYNATLLYENEKKGLFFYFEKVSATYLLADQPNDLIGDIVKDSKVDRKKGIHMNQHIKDWGEGAIRDWLVEEYAPGKKNLSKLMSEPLLEELIAYNDKGNFDRVMSFMLVVMYQQQLHKVHVKQNRLENKKRLLFPDGLFTGYDNYEYTPSEENYLNISI